MFEVINLVCFAVVCYLLLIGVPSIVEQVSSEEFKNAYLKVRSRVNNHVYSMLYENKNMKMGVYFND